MIGSTIGHYQILEKLGEGGMGIVYKAQDTTLDRLVALKFLPPEFSRDADAKRRFINEAKAASALDHPNICTVYEIAETNEGRLFIVMAHYEGETLSERIKRGPLNTGDAVTLALQIAEGLQAAHDQGIVHRDIKSSNVFVTRKGQAKILDFGIARRLDQTMLTKTTGTVGTVPYMSPEQVRGDTIDHRTDIWSFGVMLYEMIAGRLPYSSAYSEAIIYSILNQDPPPLASLRTDVPATLEKTVLKALQKNLSDRYSTVLELHAELVRHAKQSESGREVAPAKLRTSRGRFLVFGVLAAFVGLLVLALVYFYPGKATVLDSIAVLPFEEASRDTADAYFAEGIAEELIVALSKVPGLRVAGRASSFRFRDKSEDTRKIGRALNVATLLDGSVRRSGRRMRVVAELTNAADGSLLWGESYELEIRDAFALQDEITGAIGGALRIRLARSTDSVGSAPAARPVDPEAYEAYLKGLSLRRRSGKFVEQSIPYFERAVASDSSFARAWAQLGWALAALPLFSRSEPPDLPERAFAAVRRAIALDATSGEARGALAGAYLFISGDITRAIEEAQQAVTLEPNLSDGHLRLAIALAAAGDYDRAVATAQRGFDLDPISGAAGNILARTQLYARHFTGAVASARIAVQLDSLVPHAPGQQAVAELSLGHRDSARAIALRLLDIPVIAVHRSFVLAATGDQASNAALLRTLESQRSTRFSGETALAAAYLGMGDSTRALLALERAAKRRESFVAIEFGHPMFDPIRGNARFVAILRAYGVDPEKVNSVATRRAQ